MVSLLMTLLMDKFTSIVIDDQNLDEKSRSKWQFLQYCKSPMPKLCHEEIRIMLGQISVGDTTQAV